MTAVLKMFILFVGKIKKKKPWVQAKGICLQN